MNCIQKYWCIFYLVLVQGFFFSTSTLAQEITLDPSFVMDSWTVDDGLPINTIVSIIQSSDGYLWLGTFNGLVRFDGITFKTYQAAEYPGLVSNRIIDIYQAKDGSLWLETEQNQVIIFKDGVFKRLTAEDGLNGSRVTLVHGDNAGNIWVGTESGISKYDGVTFSPFNPDLINKGVYQVFVERSGAVWFTNLRNNNFSRYENGIVQDFGLKNISSKVSKIKETDDGTIWLGLDRNLYTYSNDSLILYHTFPNEIGEILGASISKNGIVRVSTRNRGFLVEKENNWIQIEAIEYRGINRYMNYFYELPKSSWLISGTGVFYNDKEILHLPQGIYGNYLDKEGNLWIATINEGLIRLKVNPFTTLSEQEGLSGKNVYPVLEDKDGTIWAGVFADAVHKIKDGIVMDTILIKDRFNGSFFTSLFQASDGTMYAGAIGHGLVEKKDYEDEFRILRYQYENLPNTASAIFEHENGVIWFGSQDGLFYKSETQTGQVQANGIPITERVRFFLEAPDRSLWMATNGSGILHHKDGIFTTYSKKDGLPSDLIRSLYINSVAEDGSYTLWVGTEDIGLIRLEIENTIPNFEKTSTYSTKDGLLDFTIHIILEDDFGNFWMNTNKGIYRVSAEELERVHRDNTSSLNGISYTKSDGLRNPEGNGGMQPAGIKSSDGNYWFPTQDGIVVFNPSDLLSMENNNAPPIVIEEIETNARTVYLNKKTTITLDKKERDFEIRFTALSLSAPEKNDFRYRLAGFNNNWQETNGQRFVSYTNVPNGSYSFEVTASNNTGMWNPSPQTIKILVGAYFYETVWFKLLLIFSGFFIFLGIIQWRTSSLKMKEEELIRLVAERTSELEQEKRKTELQSEELRKLDKAKTRFFTNISHELRTPLTLIISPLQQLLFTENERFDAKLKHTFELMLRNGNRLLRLVDQTLQLTKLEHGTIKIRVEKIDLSQFLRELVSLFKFIAIENYIDITLSNCDKPHFVYADPDKLDKIIANLISNAIKFTPDNGQIHISLHTSEMYTSVIVEDSGIGMQEKELDKIFNRFYQVDDSDTRFQEGFGVGLSLAKDLALLHHGELNVESMYGIGSTFTLRLLNGKKHFISDAFSKALPVFENDVLLQNEKTNRTNIDKYNKSRNETTILVVEDNSDMRAFITNILKNKFAVIEAENGIEAIDVVTSRLPDLIIADIMMPKMDGITFNRKLKEDALTSSIPLIFLTAKSTDEDKIFGLKEGADDYLTKPFNPNELTARVNNLIESRYRLKKILEGASNLDVEKEKKTDPFLQKVDSILALNYSNPDFSIKELSSQLFLDRSQVLRKLKKIDQTTPTEYLKRFRIKKATEFLKKGTGNISEIAYASGFKSLSYFSAVFKEYHNCSPSEYLKK